MHPNARAVLLFSYHLVRAGTVPPGDPSPTSSRGLQGVWFCSRIALPGPDPSHNMMDGGFYDHRENFTHSNTRFAHGHLCP